MANLFQMIVLEVGQCGIQVGQSLFDEIDKSKECSMLFDQFIVDTELKAQQRANTRSDHIYIKGSFGRGNNWANGHFDNVDDIMDGYRKLVESKCVYDGCVMIHSLAGGTGSGLGTRILSEIREEYSKSFNMTVSIAPFITGETAVQNYNALLSMEVLQRCSDLILYISNDHLFDCATRLMQSQSHKIKNNRIPLDYLNSIASKQLLNFIKPVNEAGEGKSQKRFDLAEFVYDLAPIPQYKLCTGAVSLLNDRLESWDDVMGSLIRNIEYKEDRLCLASKLFVRGADHNLQSKITKLLSRFNGRVGVPLTMDAPLVHISFATGHKNKDGAGYECGAVLNSNAVVEPLQTVLGKAKSLYSHRAYLHWYERYCKGDMTALFDDAFESLSTICDSYKDLEGFQ